MNKPIIPHKFMTGCKITEAIQHLYFGKITLHCNSFSFSNGSTQLKHHPCPLIFTCSDTITLILNFLQSSLSEKPQQVITPLKQLSNLPLNLDYLTAFYHTEGT